MPKLLPVKQLPDFIVVDATKQSMANATYVRYVSSMTLVVVLQSGTTEGKINPPYMRITYSEVERTAAEKGAAVQVGVTGRNAVRLGRKERPLFTNIMPDLHVVYKFQV